MESDAAPAAAENVPAGHSAQLLPGGPHEPALQLQFVTVVLPVGDMALVGHACLSLAELPQKNPAGHNIPVADDDPFGQ